jgi:hemerythrin-like domain-containing protein
MSEQTVPSLAEDLLRIHRVVTRSLNVALPSGQKFAESGFPDDSTREGFYNYIRSLSILLNSHHMGEDEIAFPRAKERMPGIPVDHLCADHKEMTGILSEIDQLLVKSASGAKDDEVLPGLNDALGRLNDLWTDHIHLEEEVFAARKLREAFKDYEQADLSRDISKYSMKHHSPSSLVVPFILYNLSEEDRNKMMSSMPKIIVQIMISVVWKNKWQSMKPFLLA